MTKLYDLLITNAEWVTLQSFGVNTKTKQFFSVLFEKETFGPARKLSEKLIYLAMLVGCVQKCFISEVS